MYMLQMTENEAALVRIALEQYQKIVQKQCQDWPDDVIEVLEPLDRLIDRFDEATDGDFKPAESINAATAE